MKNRLEEIFENCLTIEKLVELPAQGGLVLFADSRDIPILLLTTANIRRTVKNKLAEQKTKKADLKSITAKIYYIICPCRFRLALEHYKAARKIFGRNYKDHITIVYPAFIKVNLPARWRAAGLAAPSLTRPRFAGFEPRGLARLSAKPRAFGGNEKIPFFSVTKRPTFKKEEEVLGPFPSQKTATVFLNTLEEAFRLCRKSEFVNNPQRAAGCPYLQMEACCGVCGGKISPEEYQSIIKDAFEAGANPAKTIEKLQADMQTASKELNFEKAAGLKKKLEKLSILDKQNYKWTGDLKNLKIVHIDKSAKIKQEGSRVKKQTLAAFVMNFFEIIGLGDFVIDEIEKTAEAVETALLKLNGGRQESGAPSTSLRAGNILEQFAIVSYFLYRSKPVGLWADASDGFDKMTFVKIIHEKLKL